MELVYEITPLIVAAVVIWLVLMMLGAPMYVPFMIAAAMVLFWAAGVSPLSMAKIAVGGISGFSLIAIPLFILLGSIMSVCGATKVLFDLARAMIGHIYGGLAMAAIAAAAMFGTVCGSGIATALAISTIAGPELLKSGYKRPTIAAICGAAGGLGLLIPPSIDFIILGDILGVSVGDLFIAGIVPGLITTALLCVAAYIWMRHKGGIELTPPASWQTRGKAFVRVLPVAVLPLAIVGTLWGGVCTPSEAAGVSVVVAMLLARFYFKKFGWSEIRRCMRDAVRMSAAIYVIIMAAIMFGRALAWMQLPQIAGRAVLGLGLSTPAFRFFFCGLFWVMGMFFNFMVLVFVCLPPLLPAVDFYALPLVAFGVAFSMIGFVGQLTPPVALTLYAAATGIKSPAGDAIREVPIFLVVWVVTSTAMLFLPFLAVY